jgi:hypothetical protein
VSAPRVSYEAVLVEEAVLRAEGGLGAAERAAFRRERDRLYAVADADEREARFEELHGRWFTRLGLDRPLHTALGERPEITLAVAACRVGRAPSRREETADLLGAPGEPPTLLVGLRPESLSDPGLVHHLRHELGHVADMLDPAFGYERSLPGTPGGAAFENLLRERYRAVWCASLDGRAARRGHAAGGALAKRRAEFARAFPMLGPEADEALQLWFAEPRPTHAAIVAFILSPGGAAMGAGRCPVCQLPTHALDPCPERLTDAARRALETDFPDWEAAQGLCVQCADLYLARVAG